MTLTSDDLGHRLGLLGPCAAAVTTTSATPRVISVAGVAGGVGTSTVAALISSLDVGIWRQHPVAVDVLVCGPSSSSTAHAERIIATHLAGLGCSPVLVVVSDGHRRTPADSRARLTTLKPYCVDIVRVPWVPIWRDVAAPSLDPFPAQLAPLICEIQTALQLPVTQPASPRRRRRRLRKEIP